MTLTFWQVSQYQPGISMPGYYLGAQRAVRPAQRGGDGIGMRSGGVLYYLHSDHLGSTSLTTTDGGALHTEQRYYPYGEVRWTNGALPTDFTYTGQRAEDFGLMDYKARYYSPYLGRFISPDSLVPGMGSQAWNRYMYVKGNPILYRDPTGYWDEEGALGGPKLDSGDVTPISSGPPWYEEAANFVCGAVLQFADDLTWGTVTKVERAISGGLDHTDNTSDAFQHGRRVGRFASTAHGVIETATGIVETIGTLAGGGLLTIGGSAGGPGGTALGATATGLAALGPVAQTVHGVGTIARNLSDPDPLLSMAKRKGDGYKIPRPGAKGKRGATDCPSWVRGKRPYVGESGRDFATRLLDEKYGEGNWDRGPASEFNQIRKYGDRHFKNP